MNALNWSRSFRLLQFGSLVLPLLILIVWGVWAWEARKAETIARAENNAELIQQYAHSIIQSQRSLLLEAELVIKDDGIGLPKDASRNSGLRLVRALVGQVRGEIEIGEGGGAEYRIRFPLETQQVFSHAHAAAAAQGRDLVGG